jgi:hypothetical protein
MKLENILEIYPDEQFLKVDDFDEAVIGMEVVKMRLVYDISKMRQLLVDRDGMTFDEAMEYLDFNVVGAYVGELTPIFVEI